jgi:hypothetical protein
LPNGMNSTVILCGVDGANPSRRNLSSHPKCRSA